MSSLNPEDNINPEELQAAIDKADLEKAQLEEMETFFITDVFLRIAGNRPMVIAVRAFCTALFNMAEQLPTEAKDFLSSTLVKLAEDIKNQPDTVTQQPANDNNNQTIQ